MSTDTIQKTENSTVARRTPYASTRKREYLTAQEIVSIIQATASNRNAERDALMISMAFNHALRASELVELTWDQIDLSRGALHVKRVKNGDSGVHFLQSKEIRTLKRLKDEHRGFDKVFISERQTPISARAFFKMLSIAGEKAKLPFPIHPHMLRHSKGYQLANKGTDLRLIQGYMGHKNVSNTVIYTKLDANRMRGLES
ncbi:MAG TPA: tyrosine-type recombinase/integrase [Oculatellaceae cyanobacterium]